MPSYYYECLDCETKTREKYAHLIEERGELPIDIIESDIMYETSHTMSASKEEKYEACKCPRCGSHEARRTFHGSHITGYVRGDGFMDRSGCLRDMHTYKLENDDPYKEYREEGEVDHIKDKLKKTGQRDPQKQYFLPDSKSNSDKSSNNSTEG